CPVNDYRLRHFPRPSEDERRIATPIGERELALQETNSAGLVLNAKVPFALARRFGVGVALASLSPTGKGRKKGLNASISRMSVQLGRSEETHQVLGF